MYLYYPLQGTREYDATSNADETGGDDATATFGATVVLKRQFLMSLSNPVIQLLILMICWMNNCRSNVK